MRECSSSGVDDDSSGWEWSSQDNTGTHWNVGSGKRRHTHTGERSQTSCRTGVKELLAQLRWSLNKFASMLSSAFMTVKYNFFKTSCRVKNRNRPKIQCCVLCQMKGASKPREYHSTAISNASWLLVEFQVQLQQKTDFQFCGLRCKSERAFCKAS